MSEFSLRCSSSKVEHFALISAFLGLILLLQIEIREGTHASLCTFNGAAYSCKAAPRHYLKTISLPPEACVIHACHNCVKAKRTFVVLKPTNSLLKPQSFFLQPEKSHADSIPYPSSTFYECRLSDGKPCDCAQQPCVGDEQFCNLFSCDQNASQPCTCYLTFEKAEITHVSSKDIIKNPELLTLETCLFEIPSRPSRRLLESERAEFSSHNLTIKFEDPVLTLPDVGRVVLRTDDYEHVLTIREDLAITLPYELLAFPTTLTVIYIHPKGFSVVGEIHVAGKKACRLQQCLFCIQALRTVSCWPVYLQYLFYASAVFSAVLFLWLFKSFLKTLVWFLRIIALTVFIVFRFTKSFIRLCLLFGSYVGDNTRLAGLTFMRFLEERAQGIQGGAPVPQLSLVILTLLLIITPAFSDCSDHAIIHSKLENCETKGHNLRTCRLSTTAELTLKGLSQESCIWFHDTDDQPLFSLKIKFFAVHCSFHTQREYFTFPVSANHLAQISCNQNKYCGRGEHCKGPVLGHRGLHFESETPESREYPGLSTCDPGGIGVGCTILTRASCNFRRTYYVPDLLNSFEVSRITGNTCSYQLAVEHSKNGTVTHLAIKDSAYTPSGVKIVLLGAYDQPQIFLTESLVQRVGNPIEAYLVPTAPFNNPTAGMVGAVQANVSYTKTFNFDPLLSSCDFYEDRLRCQSRPDAITAMQRSQHNKLPLVRDLHRFFIKDGKLISSLLASSAVRIQLQFTDYKISVETRTVCPAISSAPFQVSGCYQCPILARLIFSAHSTCQNGLAEVVFQEITVYAKMVSLTTTPQEIVIRFLGEQRCYKEKLCLKSSTMVQCKTFDFCLDEPSIELQNLSTNYTRTIAASSPSSSLFDWAYFPSLDSAFYILKFGGAALVIVCLAVTAFSAIFTCCRR